MDFCRDGCQKFADYSSAEFCDSNIDAYVYLNQMKWTMRLLVQLQCYPLQSNLSNFIFENHQKAFDNAKKIIPFVKTSA